VRASRYINHFDTFYKDITIFYKWRSTILDVFRADYTILLLGLPSRITKTKSRPGSFWTFFMFSDRCEKSNVVGLVLVARTSPTVRHFLTASSGGVRVTPSTQVWPQNPLLPLWITKAFIDTEVGTTSHRLCCGQRSNNV